MTPLAILKINSVTHLQACLLWHVSLSSIALHGNEFWFMWFVGMSRFCIQNHIMQLACLLQEVNFGQPKKQLSIRSRSCLLLELFTDVAWHWAHSDWWHYLGLIFFPLHVFPDSSVDSSPASAFSQTPSPPHCLTNYLHPILGNFPWLHCLLFIVLKRFALFFDTRVHSSSVCN